MKKTTRGRITQRAMVVGLLAAAALVGAGCSSTKDIKGSAEKYIEGDLAEQIALGDLTATCDDVASDAEVGATFNCTADTADGQTVELLGTVADGDKVNVDTTNLIGEDGMTVIENSAVTLIEQQTGQTLGDGALECGDGPQLFDVATDNLSCMLTSPDDGSQYETTLTLSSLGADAQISIDLSQTPIG